MALANQLVYSGKLRCASEQQASARLVLAPMDEMEGASEAVELANGAWLARLVAPGASVVFADTDEVPAPESVDLRTIRNHIEAQLVSIVVRALRRRGVAGHCIGVIAPYRAHLKAIRALIPDADVEIQTVDRFQGRDKDVIVFSGVRSNASGTVGDLLQDLPRMNVAITRARRKFVLIASRSTLSLAPPWRSLLALLARGDGLIVRLPAHAHKSAAALARDALVADTLADLADCDLAGL